MAEHDVVTLPNSMRVFERGWLSSNNILFFDDEAHGGCALVDSGYLTHAPQTVALVQHALRGRPLRRLLNTHLHSCLLYTSPSPRDATLSRMPSSA